MFPSRMYTVNVKNKTKLEIKKKRNNDSKRENQMYKSWRLMTTNTRDNKIKWELKTDNKIKVYLAFPNWTKNYNLDILTQERNLWETL